LLGECLVILFLFKMPWVRRYENLEFECVN
jgi:hypothetical protein